MGIAEEDPYITTLVTSYKDSNKIPLVDDSVVSNKVSHMHGAGASGDKEQAVEESAAEPESRQTLQPGKQEHLQEGIVQGKATAADRGLSVRSLETGKRQQPDSDEHESDSEEGYGASKSKKVKVAAAAVPPKKAKVEHSFRFIK
jgi:hypothetical protein